MNSDDPGHLLRTFLWEQKWTYGSAVLAIILSEIVLVQFPNLLGEFTNSLSHGQLTFGRVAYYAAALLGVGVAQVVLYGFGQFRNGQTGRQFEYQLRKRLFDHWEKLSTAYFQRRSIGDLLNHAMTDVQAVREALSGGMNILTNAIFLLAATLFMTFRTVNVSLTLVSILPIALIPVFVVWWGPRIRGASKRVQEALSGMAELTEESFTAIRLVKATANEAVETGRFAQRVDGIVKQQLRMVRQSAMFQAFIPLMGSLSFAIALFYGGYLTVSGRISLGSFVAFTLYLAMLVTPLQQIGFVIINFQRASASLSRLRVLLTEQPDIADPEEPMAVSEVRGDIAVRIASYQYPGAEKLALRDVSFRIGAGQTLGVVGRTGSGKTTLVSLLPRIFDPPQAAVWIDGVDVRQWILTDLREAIAYVPQDGFLFSTSIGENISFGKDTVTAAQIERAAKDAAIYEEIQGFSAGFDTQIGERGVTLSGGQKQRTAIARAFIKDAPILVMDDSLSAVDMNTERVILAALRKLRRGKTTVIVAHRLSAVRHADWIIVLEEGRVVEQGTHDQLLAADGTYATIYNLQETGQES